MTTTAAPRHTVPHSARAARTVSHPVGAARTAPALTGSRPQQPRLAPTRELTRELGSVRQTALPLTAPITPTTPSERGRPTPSSDRGRPVERTDLGETYLLAQAVRRVAVTPRLWRAAIRFQTDEPFAVRIPGPKGVDVWLRTWLPGQHLGLVDLGACATAFAIVQGALDDVRADEVLGTWLTHLPTQSVRIIEPGVVHDLRGAEGQTVSIHAYSPRLRSITEHSWDDGRLTRVRTLPVAAPWQDPRVASA
jgi:hypothetical protein